MSLFNPLGITVYIWSLQQTCWTSRFVCNALSLAWAHFMSQNFGSFSLGLKSIKSFTRVARAFPVHMQCFVFTDVCFGRSGGHSKDSLSYKWPHCITITKTHNISNFVSLECEQIFHIPLGKYITDLRLSHWKTRAFASIYCAWRCPFDSTVAYMHIWGHLYSGINSQVVDTCKWLSLNLNICHMSILSNSLFLTQRSACLMQCMSYYFVGIFFLP